MKFGLIITTCYAAASLAVDVSLESPILISRGLFRSKDRKNAGLKAPLLGTSSRSHQASEGLGNTNSEAKVSANSGPHMESSIFRANGDQHADQRWDDIWSGKSGSMTASHPSYTKVSGWPRGGKVETETTAQRVKVKMNLNPPALGIVSRKYDDERWGEEVFSDKSVQRKYYKNGDGSPVTVKASLLGGGRLRMTGDQSSQRMKTGRQYEPNE